jgi:general secretion pathway protein B
VSFILDALKKSEADRLNKDTPGFSHVPDKAHEKSASHWIWIVVVLILINVIALTVMFIKPDRAPEIAAAPPPTVAPVAATPRQIVAPEPPVESPLIQPAAAQPEPALQTVSESPVREPDPRAPQSTPPATSTPQSGSFEVTESHVTFAELRAQGILKIADLHLDIHVFSQQAEDRFVFVNMSKYKENSTLDEGPVVREITPDGVILNHRGITFLLPRE